MRAPKILESHHRFDDMFDRTVILLDNGVQVFALPNPDGRFPRGIDGLTCRKVGPAFIHGDRLLARVLASLMLPVSNDRLCGVKISTTLFVLMKYPETKGLPELLVDI